MVGGRAETGHVPGGQQLVRTLRSSPRRTASHARSGWSPSQGGCGNGKTGRDPKGLHTLPRENHPATWRMCLVGSNCASLRRSRVSSHANRKQVGVEIAGLQADIANHRQRVASLRSMMSTAPEVEAQFSRLDRDYRPHRCPPRWLPPMRRRPVGSPSSCGVRDLGKPGHALSTYSIVPSEDPAYDLKYLVGALAASPPAAAVK
jgi:hypothetical protein